MLLPRKIHWFFLFQGVLIARTVEIATVRGTAASNEYFSGGEGASGGVVLYFAVIDGGEGVAVGDGAQG